MINKLLPSFCLLVVLLLAPVIALQAADSSVSSGKPNIVLIFIDDMGYADIGPFGNTQVSTPNLDKFATEGMKFTSFYATPVCSMSRACLMTGCYNVRVSIPGVLFPRNDIGLHSDEITLAEIVKQKGYATCAIGKWHLGHHPQFLPTRQGFDHYFGLPYSNDMGEGRQGGANKNPPLPLFNDEKVIETEPDQSQLTRRYTEEAVKFIREHKSEPFFVYLPHTMIHFPLAASEAFKGKSKLGLIGDAIEEIDWSVGQIMAALKELKLDDNTLVIFTSDNGPAGRAAPPFRGSKGTTFEGGVREPCMMRWPGKIPAGTTCNQIAGNIDMLPTFAKIACAETPKDRVIDGRDITSLMFNPNAAPVRDTHLYFAANNFAAIRQGEWKLFLNAPPYGSGGKKANKAKADDKKPDRVGPALYNLTTDQGETTNVADANPEIVARLKSEAEKRQAEINEHKRPAGQLSAAK
jgi:arylsulfatase A